MLSNFKTHKKIFFASYSTCSKYAFNSDFFENLLIISKVEQISFYKWCLGKLFIIQINSKKYKIWYEHSYLQRFTIGIKADKNTGCQNN